MPDGRDGRTRARGDRLTDREIAALVARIEQGRDRFDDALDDRLKQAVLREPWGEVNVADFLDDFQESIDRMEERLKPGYAASAEAAALLRQASAIDGFFRRQPPGIRGESEWNRLARDLTALAAAYGSEFPLPENVVVRRASDGEVASTTETIGRAAERVKKSLERELKADVTIDKSKRDAIVGQAERLEKDAKLLRSRLKDSRPSSAEAEQLLAHAAALQATLAGHRVPVSLNAWTPLATAARDLAAAYRMPWPPAR
ncbi:MAG TPA: hypothetical protein VD833_19825 [Vicinamibacterales bacterium]|nr:hypothetical protein [Vicinamibacterales bacterium]